MRMRKAIALMTLLACVLPGAATRVFGDVEQVISSWESSLEGWQPPAQYWFIPASDPEYGTAVTHGDYALAIEMPLGWTQGLRRPMESVFLPWPQEPHGLPNVGALSGAYAIRLDVSSNQLLSGYVGMSQVCQLALFIQGEVYVDGVLTPVGDLITGQPGYGVGYTCSYELVDPALSYDFTTDTITWDLTDGGATAGLPEFDPADGGWLDIRIHTNVGVGWGNPGYIILDNLRAVHWGTPPWPLPADGIRDGVVDYGDGDLVYSGDPRGDLNGDCVIDVADYTFWAYYCGSTLPLATDTSGAVHYTRTPAGEGMWEYHFYSDLGGPFPFYAAVTAFQALGEGTIDSAWSIGSPYRFTSMLDGTEVDGSRHTDSTWEEAGELGVGGISWYNVHVARVTSDGPVNYIIRFARNGLLYRVEGIAGAAAAGDFNGDGVVSGADYTLWANTFGNDGSPGNEDLRADGNADGIVSGSDYVIWVSNFGRTLE